MKGRVAELNAAVIVMMMALVILKFGINNFSLVVFFALAFLALAILNDSRNASRKRSG